MMRVIAGLFGSRKLKGTPPPGLRPTSDRLRETLFNILGSAVEGSRFLDACAGMGGVGIEAISREARFVCFVEQSKKACAVIRENLRMLAVSEGSRVMEAEALKALERLEREGLDFDIAFVDPPYDDGELYGRVLLAFASRPVLVEGGLLVIEHSKRETLAESVGRLRRFRVVKQGDSALSFYRAEAT
jgi:16S rRNA (guanine(966)-N(2))-methyltransferase RsmD